jgi:hypothetical protein
LIGTGVLGLKNRIGESFLGLEIKGTNILTDVAAGDPVSDRAFFFRRKIELTSLFESPIGDTLSGVQKVRLFEGLGRTACEAASAVSAVIRQSLDPLMEFLI